MAVLVVGGSGFIGSHLVRALVEKGEDVVIFDLSPNIKTIKDIVDRVKIEQGDAVNMVDVLRVIKQNNVKDVYHLVALLGDVSQQKPLQALKVNVETTLNLLEAAIILGLGKIIFASSVAVYDPKASPPVNEDAPIKPASVYGATKVLSEFYGLHYNKLFGVDFRALRFTTIYGLGKFGGATGLCSLLIEKSALGEPIKVDIADAATDWLYIKDAINSLLLARDAENLRKRVYNIGGSTHKTREVAEVVKKFIPDVEIELESKKTFPWPSSYNCSRAREEIGYKPSFTIEEGVKDFIEEVRKIR